MRTEFYQNQPSLVEDMTKTFWLILFLDTVYTGIHNNKCFMNFNHQTFNLMNMFETSWIRP